MEKSDIINYAKNIIKTEIEALSPLIESIDDNFCNILETILNCKGKIILTGIGKSGLVCQKISATLSSTGTPSFFLHPAEAIHGDIGAVDKKDIVIAVSSSGETEELLIIIPILKILSDKVIAITSKSDSRLAKTADSLFVIPASKEACHLNLAPSSSSTATLVFGDTLALSLSWLKGFSYEDFALRHTGGLIGKKLILKIEDIMHSGSDIPKVKEATLIKDVIIEMSSKRLGCVGVFDDQNSFKGIITDGDLRRAMEKHKNIIELRAADIMTINPKTIFEDERALNGLILMEKYSITTLFVKNKDGEINGVVHLHDLLKSGLKL